MKQKIYRILAANDQSSGGIVCSISEQNGEKRGTRKYLLFEMTFKNSPFCFWSIFKRLFQEENF
jgi:hypothetical protein